MEHPRHPADTCTHTSLVGLPKPGSYVIRPHERTVFLRAYYNALTQRSRSSPLHLTERVAKEPFRFFADCDGTDDICFHIEEIFNDRFWRIVRDLFEAAVKDNIGDFEYVRASSVRSALLHMIGHRSVVTISGDFMQKVHLHFPGAVTTPLVATAIIQGVRSRFLDIYRFRGGTFLNEETMIKLFDSSVS